ncbi:MAG: ethanolamine ammonia-lyase subunit EutC [Acidobacteriaceae bacterium]
MAGITRPRPKDPQPTGDPWVRLRQFTPARIGLGRAGSSLPTKALLDFELAHARARDAVCAHFDTQILTRDLRESGFGDAVTVTSQARDRREYLLRPDLGRVLDPESREWLQAIAPQNRAMAVVVADGLSAIAPQRHAVPLLREVRGMLLRDDWENITVVVANRARVALGDEIGALLGAEAAIVLIGERPGLSSPDSLGVYLTWAPRVGRADADRNCISNVRPQGLPYGEAAKRLVYLLCEARRLQLSGVALKDDSEKPSGSILKFET